MTTEITLPFDRISAADLPSVGGKGANLGEMSRAGFPVPPGFCITTEAFRRFIAASDTAAEIYAALEAVTPDDVEGVRRVGQEVRDRLRAVPIPSQVEEALIVAWEAQGVEHFYAVRSSATAEDLPQASFAGQQDTFLNVRGRQALLDSVRACWVSLFTDRAILYRARNGFSHRDVQLSVVVQRMVLPEVSGILFTADPVTNHRQIVTIDASWGLGEALVAGLVTPDHYKVDKRDWTILESHVADKQVAIRPNPGGGTRRETLNDKLRHARVLSEAQVRELAQLGTRIEAHYGKPQDIEWAILTPPPAPPLEGEGNTAPSPTLGEGRGGGQIYILQSRPITSLFPLPMPRPADDVLHVYISFGHAQVMTDPMPPMSISIWRLVLPFGKADRPTEYNPYMCSAAGRIYADLSPMLYFRLTNRLLPKALTIADPLIAQGVRDVIERDEFKRGTAKARDRTTMRGFARWIVPLLLRAQTRLWWFRPEGATDELATRLDSYVDQARVRLAAASPGAARLREARQLLGTVFVEAALSMPPYLMAGLMAEALVGRLTQAHADPADVEALARGLNGNVTTEMDLQVGDLADVARQSPALVEYLSTRDAATVLETIGEVPGGEAFLVAWKGFLERYGMRAPSELDISRPRWQENPSSLLQVVVGNLQHGKAGTHRAHHQRLVAEGEAAGERLVAAARHGPLGFLRAAIVRRLVRVARNLLAVREHPKFLIIRVVGLAKQAILEAAEGLRAEGRIDDVRDIWFLDLSEVITALENPVEDVRSRIGQRRAEFERFQGMTPPRVITSDGEIPVVQHGHADLPAGALPGNPVSAGVVEGLARVVTDPTTEVLSPGEILVAPFTDPGWTPLFINAAGLVMEVGGMMTHGSVVAREYGIPAVVGVLDATRRLRTGQRIRVDGDRGIVRVLE